MTDPTPPRRLVKGDALIDRIGKQHRYYPIIPGYNLVVELAYSVKDFSSGSRGKIGSGYGTSMYEWHKELPFNGTGVPYSALLVVELDNGREVKTPYVEWCKSLGLEVVCNRCNEDLLVDVQKPACPARGRADTSRTPKLTEAPRPAPLRHAVVVMEYEQVVTAKAFATAQIAQAFAEGVEIGLDVGGARTGAKSFLLDERGSLAVPNNGLAAAKTAGWAREDV